MNGYYNKKLSAERLKRCYDIAPPRTVQYLNAELEYVRERISGSGRILELGCGYGRFMSGLIGSVGELVGVDTSFESLEYSTQLYGDEFELFQMNASKLAFQNNSFDAVLCIQNGISAFKVDSVELMLESYRVTRPRGLCFFTSYAPEFWQHRLEWFKIQSDEGLLGEIDWEQTKDGVIVCKDGFRATTYTVHDFANLVANLDLKAEITVVDESSIFCVITKRK